MGRHIRASSPIPPFLVVYPNFAYPPIFGGINEPVQISSDVNKLAAITIRMNYGNPRTTIRDLLLARGDSKENNMMNFTGLQDRIQPYMAQGQYDEAIRECEKVWRNDPDNVRLLLLMGRLHHRAKGAQKAEFFFDLAGKHASGDQGVLRRVEMFNRATALLPTSRTDIENFCDPDIVLVQAPGWGVNTPPLGTAMLTSFARKHGYKVLPIDLNVEFYLNRPPEFDKTWELEQSQWFWETIDCVKRFKNAFGKEMDAFVDLVIATNTPLVGFTVYTSSMYLSMELARLLKKRRPELKIIFGGPHVSRFLAGLWVIKDPAVDAVAQGEGELTLIDVIERVKTGRPLTDCPGLLVRANDQVVDTGDRELLKDLNQVPAPDFADYAFELYRTPTRLPLMSSRGCPNRCIFCNERPFWKTFRYRTAENVFAEIQSQLARYSSVNFLDFQDSLVNGMIRELDHLADLIIESGLRVSWAGQAVIRKEMTPELMTKLKRSGCVCLAYGLETPSESLMLKVGKVMSKGADVNDIAEAHGKTGLGATYNFMFGLPGETEEDAFETQEFLRRNKKYSLSVNPSSHFCGFAPGTLAYEDPQPYGLDLSKGGLYWESTDGRNTYISRLKRFEDFCRLVQELGIQTTYPSTILLDRNRTLGTYYAQAGDVRRARRYFEAWLEEHPDDEHIRASLVKVIASDPIFLAASLAVSGCDQKIGVSYTPPNHTDQNWVKGIAKKWATAFFIENSIQAKSDFAVCKKVTFSDGTVRTIVEQKETAGSLIVFLGGTPLDGNVVGYPKKFIVHSGIK